MSKQVTGLSCLGSYKSEIVSRLHTFNALDGLPTGWSDDNVDYQSWSPALRRYFALRHSFKTWALLLFLKLHTNFLGILFL